MDSKTETNMEFAQDSRPNMNCYGSPVTLRTQDELAGVQANLSDSVAQPIADQIVSIVGMRTQCTLVERDPLIKTK